MSNMHACMACTDGTHAPMASCVHAFLSAMHAHQAKMMGLKALDAAQILIDDLELGDQLTPEQFIKEREEVRRVVSNIDREVLTDRA